MRAGQVCPRSRGGVGAQRWGRVLLAATVFFVSLQAAATDEATAPTGSASSASAGVPFGGFAVLAREGAADAAWSLAKAIYAQNSLRPGALDEAHARVLAGEPPPKNPGDGGVPEGGRSSSDLADLAETRAAVHGDDAPSRQLLTAIATMFQLRGIVVVEMVAQTMPPHEVPARRARARLFFPKTGFDAAEYGPDAGVVEGTPSPTWTAAVASLARTYVWSPVISAPNATHSLPAPVKAPEHEKRAFYTSPWFWGAVGAAVFAGGALFLATRDNAPSTIHLQVQVPK